MNRKTVLGKMLTLFLASMLFIAFDATLVAAEEEITELRIKNSVPSQSGGSTVYYTFEIIYPDRTAYPSETVYFNMRITNLLSSTSALILAYGWGGWWLPPEYGDFHFDIEWPTIPIGETYEGPFGHFVFTNAIPIGYVFTGEMGIGVFDGDPPFMKDAFAVTMSPICIRADGSVEPDTAPISSIDNITYTFTDNIYGSKIRVERDNIVVDGADYTLQGTGSGTGISLHTRSNVTIKNMEIKAFKFGIVLSESSYNNISGNIVTENNLEGIVLVFSSKNNTISGNNITNSDYGIRLVFHSKNNTISGNNIANNRERGIELNKASNHNIISGNNIINNLCGLYHHSSNNIIYHNNFVDNTEQVHIFCSTNIWDDGYPSGGNYWSDYEERYPDAIELDGSGIWNTPYVIDDYNQDNYPLMEPWTPIDELKAEIEELGSEGEIDNRGIVKSLIAKLNVAQKLVEDGKIDQAENILNAFINEVQAQSGKHITPEAANILIESAEYILSHL